MYKEKDPADKGINDSHALGHVSRDHSKVLTRILKDLEHLLHNLNVMGNERTLVQLVGTSLNYQRGRARVTLEQQPHYLEEF